MSNVRLSDILNTLTKEEIIDFQRFVSSPYFYKGPVQEEIPLLLKFLLKKNEMAASEDNFNRKAAYAFIFPNQPYVDKKLEKALTLLHNLLKRFTGIQGLNPEEQEFEEGIRQLKFFRTRALHNRFENLQSKILQGLSELETTSQEKIRQQFYIDYESLIHEFVSNYKKAYKNIPQTLESLERYYLLYKLELLNQYLLTQKTALFNLPPEIEESVVNSYFPEKVMAKDPMILLSYKTFRLLGQVKPSLKDFDELQELFQENEKYLPEAFIKVFLTYLRNFCTILNNSNRHEFLPKVFELAKEHYQRGYLYYQGKISPSAIISIGNTALQLGEIEWCKSFLEQNEDKIFNDTPDQIFFRLCRANLLFAEKEYDKALDILPFSFPSVDFHLLAKRLELKCYFELRSEILDARIDAFKVYVNRASKTVIPDDLRERNGSFINILSQIYSSIPGSDSKRVEKILKRIEEKELLAEREWLTEKARLLA